MSDNEILQQLKKLQRYVGEAREYVDRCHHDHSESIEKLTKAENIAIAIHDEIELQQGERLAATVTA